MILFTSYYDSFISFFFTINLIFSIVVYLLNNKETIKMFCDSHNFKIIEEEDGYRHAFHHRELGAKDGHLYPGKKWSDVTLNNVSIDMTCDLENYDDFLHILNEASVRREPRTSELNEKKVSQEIIVSETSDPEPFTKGSNRERTKLRQKKGIKSLKRMRTIPPKKKKYPTKPVTKGDDKIIKIQPERDHFQWEIYRSQQEKL